MNKVEKEKLLEQILGQIYFRITSIKGKWTLDIPPEDLAKVITDKVEEWIK